MLIERAVEAASRVMLTPQLVYESFFVGISAVAIVINLELLSMLRDKVSNSNSKARTGKYSTPSRMRKTLALNSR